MVVKLQVKCGSDTLSIHTIKNGAGMNVFKHTVSEQYQMQVEHKQKESSNQIRYEVMMMICRKPFFFVLIFS